MNPPPLHHFCILRNPFFMVDRLIICETHYEITLIRASGDSSMDIIKRLRRIYTGFSFQITYLRDKTQRSGSRDSVEVTSVQRPCTPPNDSQLANITGKKMPQKPTLYTKPRALELHDIRTVAKEIMERNKKYMKDEENSQSKNQQLAAGRIIDNVMFGQLTDRTGF